MEWKTGDSFKRKQGRKIIAEIEVTQGKDAQLIMAKATGHFKHGNEKKSRSL